MAEIVCKDNECIPIKHVQNKELVVPNPLVGGGAICSSSLFQSIFADRYI